MNMPPTKPCSSHCSECAHYVPAPEGHPTRWQCGIREWTPAAPPETFCCPLWEPKP